MGLLLDIVDGHDAELNKDGWRCTRIARIEGVTGTGSEKIVNASEYTGVPQYGDEHPNIPGTYVTRISVGNIDGDTVDLIIHYAKYAHTETDYDLGAAASQQETNLDVDGDEVYVGYKFPTNYKEPAYQGFTDVQGAVYSKYVPEISYRVAKSEGITRATLLARSKQYQNTVNKIGWNIDPGAPEGSWLCTELRGRKTGADFWTVYYTFLYKPPFKRNSITYAGWNETLVYIDPNTGKPPDPSTWTSETMKIIMPYESENFNNLSVT